MEDLLIQMDGRLKNKYHIFSKLLSREDRVAKWRKNKKIKLLREGTLTSEVEDKLDGFYKEDSKASEGVITLVRKSWKDKCVLLNTKSKRILSILVNVSKDEVLLITNFYAPSSNVKKNDKFFSKMANQVTSARREEITLKKVKIIGIDIGDANAVLSNKDKKVSNGIDSSFCHKGVGLNDYLTST